MYMHKVFLAALGVLLMASSAQATVITGNINEWYANDWPVTPAVAIGDGTNQVTFGLGSGGAHAIEFYGRSFLFDTGFSDSEVAFATGVTDISQITDASIFSFTAERIGPYCDAFCDPDGVGDFIVAKNISMLPYGVYFGVLRIDEIQFINLDLYNYPTSTSLNGTWWFQTDGTGDFSSVSSVPEPSTYMLFGIGLLVLLGYRVRHKAIK